MAKINPGTKLLILDGNLAPKKQNNNKLD